jgi:hypothetical protein
MPTRWRCPPDSSPGQHVFHHGQAFNQRVFLKDHPHLAPRLAQGGCAQFGQVSVIQKNRAAGRFNQPVDAADQGGFARTRWPDQRQNLAFGHL